MFMFSNKIIKSVRYCIVFIFLFKAGKGILRSMKGDYRGVADIIPVDIPVNMIIAAAWYTAVTKPSSCLIYHSTTGSVNPFTWGELGQLLLPFNLKPNTLTFLLFIYIYWIYHLKIFIEINAKLKIFVYYFSFLHTPSDKLNWYYAHYMNHQLIVRT